MLLNAVAKLTTDAAGAVADAAGAVADKVADVLPIPHKEGQDQSEPADVNVARDQDTEKSKEEKKKQDLSEGPLSRPLSTYPTISGDLGDLDLAPASAPTTAKTGSSATEPKGKKAEQNAEPTFQTTEKVTTPEGKEKVVTHKDNVELPEEAKAHQNKGSQHSKGQKDTQKDTHKQAATQGQQHKKNRATKGHKDTQKPTSQVVTSSGDTGVSSQQFTAGSQPLPKMSPGKTKWMSSQGGWYPDRAGILHAPGVYINRKPRGNYLNPMNKIEVSF